MYRSRISCIRRISASAGTSSGKVQGGFIGAYLSACLIIGGAENAAYLAYLPPPRLGLLKTKLRQGWGLPGMIAPPALVMDRSPDPTSRS
jgi:hypothetical protein